MWPFKKSGQPIYGSALLDTTSQMLLTTDPTVAVVVFLTEAIPASRTQLGVELPGILNGSPRNNPKWTWDTTKRRFERTHAAIPQEIRDRAVLASVKARTVSHVMRSLSNARVTLSTGIFMQESVYHSKKIEATEFRAGGYLEKRAFEYPYVLQYADQAGLTLRQAADEIILHAKFDDDILAKTELLRIKYFNEIKRARNPDEIRAIAEQFELDYYRNAKV